MALEYRTITFLFINITFCRVTSLTHTTARNHMSMRTQLWLPSGPLFKQMCSQLTATVEGCRAHRSLQGVRVTIRSLTLS